jgi:T4 RnlA family RNA ligase
MTMDEGLFKLYSFIVDNDDWLEKLSAPPYNLRIKLNPKRENEWMFSYNMIATDFSDPMCRVCRGLILRVPKVRTFDNIDVVVRAFDKFFNYGESNAAAVDWGGRIWALTKYDGSLIKFTIDKNYNPRWFTNNGFDCSAELPGDLICEFNSFQDLINFALRDRPLDLTMCQEYTLMFELCSNWNRIVVPYQDTDLIFLGARHKRTGMELLPWDFARAVPEMEAFQMPKQYELSSKTLEKAIEIVSKFDINNEGLVVVDEHFNRVKIKGAAYLSVHALKDNSGQLSFAHVLKSIQSKTVDDILGIFPEYTDTIKGIIKRYNDVDQQLQTVIVKSMSYYEAAKKYTDPKEMKKAYAMLCKDDKFAKVYFQLYQNWTNDKRIKEEYLQTMDYETLEKLTA